MADHTGETGDTAHSEKREENAIAKFMVIGLAIGAVLGSATDKLTVGVGLGLAVGVIVGGIINARKTKAD